MNRLFQCCVVGLAIVLNGIGVAAALDPAQKQALANAETYLKHVEENLKLAQDAAGPGEGVPAASKVKLAKMRLEQAVVNLPPAVDLLKTLPADDAAVKAAQARAEAAAAGIAKLNDRLSAKGTAPPENPASSGKKLDHRQEEQLKGADFNLREVEGSAEALIEIVTRLRAVTDQQTIDYREVERGVNTIDNAQRKAGFVEDALARLPTDGAGVAEIRERLSAAEKSVAASTEFLYPLHTKLRNLIDPATYPTLDADLKRLSELAQMYGDANVLSSRPTQAAAVLQQKDAALAESLRIAKLYGPLIGQQTELGKRVEGAGRYFSEKYQAFLFAAGAIGEGLPDAIRADLAKVSGMADEAVKNKTAGWFVGSIPDRIVRVEEKLALLQVINAPAAEVVAKELAALKGQLAQRQKSLEALIIEQTAVPPDRYKGSDRHQLEAIATRAWKDVQPDAQVLGVYIPSAEWERSTLWQYRNSAWHFIDGSRLQAQLIVVQDARLAVIRAVNLTKDHQKNDQISAIPLNALNAPVIPQHLLLRSKLN